MVQMYYNTWVKILDSLEILKLPTEAITALIPVSINTLLSVIILGVKNKTL
jgi:hypothetical protein